MKLLCNAHLLLFFLSLHCCCILRHILVMVHSIPGLVEPGMRESASHVSRETLKGLARYQRRLELLAEVGHCEVGVLVAAMHAAKERAGAEFALFLLLEIAELVRISRRFMTRPLLRMR